MGRSFKNTQTPEEQYRAEREQAWRAENAESLHYRGLLIGLGSKRSEARINEDFPLTPKPEPADPAAPKKKRGWFR